MNGKVINLTFVKGAERAIRHLHKHHIPIAIGTSSQQDAVEIKFQNYQDIYKMFHHVVSGGTDSDVKRGKPAPDIFLVCAGRFPGNPPVSKCLVFEDSVNGVKAALAAGMQVVMIPDSRVPYDDWKEATIRLDSFDCINFGWFGLPPYPDDDDNDEYEDIEENIQRNERIIALTDELGVQYSQNFNSRGQIE